MESEGLVLEQHLLLCLCFWHACVCVDCCGLGPVKPLEGPDQISKQAVVPIFACRNNGELIRKVNFVKTTRSTE